MGGPNGKWGGRVAGYGRESNEDIYKLVNQSRSGAMDQDQEVTVIVLQIVLILKLERSRLAFLSLSRLPGWAWRYSTSGAGEKDSVPGTMPRVTSKSYLLVGRGVWLTVIIG